jgi:hypothetical protein
LHRYSVEGRKVWLHLEVRDGLPNVCHWPEEEEAREEREEREEEGGDEDKRDGGKDDDEKAEGAAVGKKPNGGAGSGDGTVYATGSALFIVLAKD